MFKHDVWSWAKDRIVWRAFFVIAPVIVMVVAYQFKPDYRTIWITLLVYAGVLAVYCLVVIVQIPAKLDRERMAEISERETQVASLKAAVSKAESTTTDPLICLVRERQKLESELQPLVAVEESGVKVFPQIKIGKDESDFRREKIDHLKRDIHALSTEIEQLQSNRTATVATQWKELADRFGAAPQFARADWQHGGLGKAGGQVIETWRFAGDVNSQRTFEPLCRMAGKMLLGSPKALSKASKHTQAETDDVRRWLYFLKDRGAVSMNNGCGVYEGGHIFMGSINDLATVSKNACLDCTAEES